jgi:hypothetical protein
LVERAAAYQSTLEPEAGADYFLNRLKDFHGFGRDLRPNPIAGKYSNPIQALHTFNYLHLTRPGPEITRFY